MSTDPITQNAAFLKKILVSLLCIRAPFITKSTEIQPFQNCKLRTFLKEVNVNQRLESLPPKCFLPSWEKASFFFIIVTSILTYKHSKILSTIILLAAQVVGHSTLLLITYPFLKGIKGIWGAGISLPF